MQQKATYLAILTIACTYAIATASIATTEAIYLKNYLNTSYSLLGIILGISAITYLLVGAHLKKLPKRYTTKRYLIWTSNFLAVTTVLAINITNPILYIISKTALVLAVPITFHTLIHHVEEAYKYHKNHHVHIFATSISAAVGGIIGFISAGVLADIHIGYAYLLATGAFILAGIAAHAITTKKTYKHKKTTVLSLTQRIQTCLNKHNKPLALTILVTNTYWAIRDIALPLLLLSQGYSITAIGALFALGAISGLASMLVARHLLEKNHPEHVLTTAVLIAAIASIILPFGGFIVIGVTYSIYVFAESAATPAISDKVQETSPTHHQQTDIESFSAATATGWVIGPILAGLLLETTLSLTFTLFIAGALHIGLYEYLRRTYLSKHTYLPKLSIKRKNKSLIWN